MASVQMEDTFFLVGGSDVYEYLPDTETWDKKEGDEMVPTFRYNLGAVLVSDSVVDCA